MNCRTVQRYVQAIACGVTIAAQGCKESLPVYVPPSNILELSVSTVEQLNDRRALPDHQMVRLVLACKNTHDEVFYDSVDIRGSMRVWWERKPSRYRTLYLSSVNFREKDLISHGKLLIVPGQSVSFESFWNLKSDDSMYLPLEMNFAFLRRRLCAYNVACSDPETFVVEASLNLYNALGYIVAPASRFVFTGRSCIECGVGPVCPPPPGGCAR